MEDFITKEDLGITQNGILGRFVASVAMKTLRFEKINELISGIDADNTVDFVNTIIGNLDVSIRCSDESLNNIPNGGGFVAVANFPHGVVDCLMMMSLIGKVRKDIKFLVDPQLAGISFFKSVSVLPSDGTKYSLVKNCVNHLRNGGVLIIFPAVVVGGYSHFLSRPVEAKWRTELFKVAKIAKVPMIPFYIYGHASRLFLTIGQFLPYAKPLMYPRELLKSEGRTLEVAIGKGVNYSEILEIAKAKNFNVQGQSQIVSETFRGLLYLQSIKLNEDFVAKTNVESLQEQECQFNAYDVGVESTLSVGRLNMYMVDNQVVVKNGAAVLMVVNFKKHLFNSSGSVSKMDSLGDFEFNYRQLTKSVKSCVEMYDLSVDCKMAACFADDLEKLLKMFVKLMQVDVLMTNIKSVRTFNNVVSSAFLHYLEDRHVKGVMSRSVLSRGMHRHDEYVGGMLKNETANFYSASLFAKYGAQLDCIDVPEVLLIFLKMGAKVACISRKYDDKDRFIRSFLVSLS